MQIEVIQGIDETGRPEEFTWDLLPVVDPERTSHLDEHGLPRVGSQILPGMILVGKIGRSPAYDAQRQPAALELQGFSFEELNRKYGAMWRDASLYATAETSGTVTKAEVICAAGQTIAVVELRRDLPLAIQTGGLKSFDTSVSGVPAAH